MSSNSLRPKGRKDNFSYSWPTCSFW